MGQPTDKRTVVKEIRDKNRRDIKSSDLARSALQKMLPASHTHPWMYVYELTQNARDAGARRVYWRSDEDSVFFQHDGDVELNKRHVEAISSLGYSTKGLTDIGFMGIGFKSVFASFRRARVSGFGWRFSFKVRTREGPRKSVIAKWTDTLLPAWDEEAPDPEKGYTTAFSLEQPAKETWSAQKDLSRIASLDDPAALAILALRGLEQVRVNDLIWDLSVNDGVAEVRCSVRDHVWRWKCFTARYRPSDDAMRQLLEVRQATHEHLDDDGRPVEREVIALLLLDREGQPNPPRQGRVFATLPTQERIPFGFHLQADWFVIVDRQSLRNVDGDPWQQAIVEQVPELVRQLLLWLTGESYEARKRGYAALQNPNDHDESLPIQFKDLRQAFQDALSQVDIVPIQGIDTQRFRAPEAVRRLPRQFQANFGGKLTWRSDLLFGHDLMDKYLLGHRGTAFADWLGWGEELGVHDVNWNKTLPAWWAALPDEERYDALFALWEAVGEHEWDEAPVVPTDAGHWVPAEQTRWLNEEPPADNQPGGREVADALRGLLPDADERVLSSVKLRMKVAHAGIDWLKDQHQEVELAELLADACRAAEEPDRLPLVKLLEWAISRGTHRQNLVPLVLTEQGAVHPEKALLADPLIEDASHRRHIFPDIPVLVSDYANISNRQATVSFLILLGVQGGGSLVQLMSWKVRSREEVAKAIQVDVRDVKDSNPTGFYTIVDSALPFDATEVPHDALQDWLSRECNALENRGRLYAQSRLRGKYLDTPGTVPATWVKTLEDIPWLECTDGERRKPTDVLLEPNSDFEDAPIAKITQSLASRLRSEGMRFGADVSKSSVLYRLARKGASKMPDGELAELLTEALDEVKANRATQDELQHALMAVRLHGETPLTRVVERAGTGSGYRSDFGGWVVALSQFDPALSSILKELNPNLPPTTTGHHALDYLHSIWEKQPQRVDDLRRPLAAAYRYVLEDADSDADLAVKWEDARPHVRLYGDRKWWPLGPNLAVDDIRSPFIRQLLPDDRVTVVSAHLGDEPDHIRDVAGELGLGLLSAELTPRPGKRISPPTWAGDRLQMLLHVLSSLENRRPLADVAFHRKLMLDVGGARHDISAYVENGILRLVADSPDLAVEATEQLMEYFQLGQRTTEVPRLTGALLALEDEKTFRRHLQILAGGLEVEMPEWPSSPTHASPAEALPEDEPLEDESGRSLPVPENEVREVDNVSEFVSRPRRTTPRSDTDVDSTDAPSVQHHRYSRASGHGDIDEVKDRVRKTVSSLRSRIGYERRATAKGEGTDARKTTTSHSMGQGADHSRLLLLSDGDEEEAKSKDSKSRRGEKKSDHKARQAVIHYETHCERRAEAMDDAQPAFDVLSFDDSTGHCRLIEVKGMEGIFKGNASVVLTARQFLEGIWNEDDGIEYWLYVVDSTETNRPRVLPIPWTRHVPYIRYGFHARVWRRDVVCPATVTGDGTVRLLPS